MKVSLGMKVYNDHRFIRQALASTYMAVDHIVVAVSDRPWNGEPSSPDKTLEYLHQFPDHSHKIQIVEGSWTKESDHVNFILDFIREKYPDTDYYFYQDADEVYFIETMDVILKVLDQQRPDGFGINMRTYVKWPTWKVFPPEVGIPFVAFPLTPELFFADDPDHCRIPHPYRDAASCVEIDSPDPRLYMHHFSYVGTPTEISNKLAQFSHADKVRPRWLEDVFIPATLETTNLHPTHPDTWAGLEKVSQQTLPETVQLTYDEIVADLYEGGTHG